MTLRSGVTVLLACGALIGTAAPAQAAQVPDAHCDEWINFTSGVSAWAQTFTAEHTGPLTKARFYIATNSVVSLEVSIHAVDGSGLPTGPALATTTLNNIPARPSVSFTPLADNFVDASFAPGAQVTAGQFYALAVKRVAGTGFSILQSTGDQCAGTAFKDEDVNGTWEVYGMNTIDLAMAVFVGDPETTTPPLSGGGGPPAAPPKPPVPPKPPPIVSIRGTSLFFLNGQTCQVVTRVDAAGTVTVTVYGNVPFAKASKKKKKRYPIGKKTVRTTKAGKVELNVPVSKAARKAIAGKGKLKATLEVTFTPAGGGKATTKKKSITLKPEPKPKPKKR